MLSTIKHSKISNHFSMTHSDDRGCVCMLFTGYIFYIFNRFNKTMHDQIRHSTSSVIKVNAVNLKLKLCK